MVSSVTAGKKAKVTAALAIGGLMISPWPAVCGSAAFESVQVAGDDHRQDVYYIASYNVQHGS